MSVSSVAAGSTSILTSAERSVPSGASPFSCTVWSPVVTDIGILYAPDSAPAASAVPSPSSVGVEKIHTDASLSGMRPDTETSNVSPILNTGIPRRFSLVPDLREIRTMSFSPVRTV